MSRQKETQLWVDPFTSLTTSKLFMRHCLLILFIALLPFCGQADASLPKAPKEVRTRDELVKTFGKEIGFGPVQRAEFGQFGRQIFAVWNCPFSGRAACYLHAYYYDPKKAEWILFLDRLVEGASDLSAEMPSRGEVLIFRDANGQIVVQESVAKFPMEEWYEKK